VNVEEPDSDCARQTRTTTDGHNWLAWYNKFNVGYYLTHGSKCCG
jgi:hypothetical protein